MHAETTPGHVPSLTAYRYADVYRRVDGAWKFAARELAFLYNLSAVSAHGTDLRL